MEDDPLAQFTSGGRYVHSNISIDIDNWDGVIKGAFMKRRKPAIAIGSAEPSGSRGKDDPRRLERYGLTPAMTFSGNIIVPPNTVLRLSYEERWEQAKGFNQLRPKTMDDVKRWIGVPDEAGKKHLCATECLSSFSMVQSSSELRNLNSAQLRALHAMGEIYVHGDSRLVAPHRQILDLLLADAYINGVFVRQDIDVYGVLEISANIRILFARNVTIWNKGTIRCLGDTKIDCLGIEGRIWKGPLDKKILEFLPKIGELMTMEVANA